MSDWEPDIQGTEETGLLFVKKPRGYSRDKIYHVKAKQNGNEGKELRAVVSHPIFAAVEECRERYRKDFRSLADVTRNAVYHYLVQEAEKDPDNHTISIAVAAYQAEHRQLEITWLESTHDTYENLLREGRDVPERIEEIKKEIRNIVMSLSDEFRDHRDKLERLLRYE